MARARRSHFCRACRRLPLEGRAVGCRRCKSLLKSMSGWPESGPQECKICGPVDIGKRDRFVNNGTTSFKRPSVAKLDDTDQIHELQTTSNETLKGEQLDKKQSNNHGNKSAALRQSTAPCRQHLNHIPRQSPSNPPPNASLSKSTGELQTLLASLLCP